MERENAGYEKQCLLGLEVLDNCRNHLYHLFPYLDGAFASISCQPSQRIKTMGTEGEKFYFSPEFILYTYGTCPGKLYRGYLHMLLHCLYLHPFPDVKYEERLWNLACDIAVEQIIEAEVQPSLKLPESTEGCGRPENRRMSVRRELMKKLGPAPVSAQAICQFLSQEENVTEELCDAFAFDDHTIWKEALLSGRASHLRKKWEKLLAYTSQSREENIRRAGVKSGTKEMEIDALYRSRYDYRKFLRRFSVPGEEVELDTESFDYIFYTYGMEHYDGMPFIEPLEYREVDKLEELVIAIDTSGSCKKETVQKFLDETYAILSSGENFFKKMKVHLLQCDCSVLDAAVIHSEEEWKEYSKNIRIKGRGGTDFRPVFRYIQDQERKKELKSLRALIYFTDGDGIYPRSRPHYETAFVFVKKTDSMKLVPPWAYSLLTTL